MKQLHCAAGLAEADRCLYSNFYSCAAHTNRLRNPTSLIVLPGLAAYNSTVLVGDHTSRGRILRSASDSRY